VLRKSVVGIVDGHLAKSIARAVTCRFVLGHGLVEPGPEGVDAGGEFVRIIVACLAIEEVRVEAHAALIDRHFDGKRRAREALPVGENRGGRGLEAKQK
jgi:hypothetical protein